MTQPTIAVLRGIIALALAGSVIVEAMILPAVWRDTEGTELWRRVVLVTLLALFVGAMQVIAVCVWQLLTKVRQGSVFSRSSFGYVDAVIVSLAAAAVVVFGLAALMAAGEAAPGVVGLVCGAALVFGGVALVVVVMRALLRQAIDRESEARTLRAELDEVV
ncbi:DUF2975 domain-containing protein [Microbacterium sp. T2.11-28]|uniref:DUF2975 domain-containing protein n=1 Tax=Microbacterium sp. T2.11-28 TaxID=3041169 RepID=UPI0024774DA9|nr:DUF2975 domain-containing protein [Microbacterium sp. T2.11-28]CAI9389415.1 hypothetical protein MICABA_01089 [Microbacterium sp. T2.11-28]